VTYSPSSGFTCDRPVSATLRSATVSSSRRRSVDQSGLEAGATLLALGKTLSDQMFGAPVHYVAHLSADGDPTLTP